MSNETGWALNRICVPEDYYLPRVITPEIIVENSSIQSLHLKYRQTPKLRSYDL